MAEPKLGESSVRLVATTLPGYGGTTPTEDVSIEGYARAASKLAADLGCDVVLGHSTGGDVALEMAAGAGYAGSLVLLSPSFSLQDEAGILRVVDRLSDVFGHLPWSAVLKIIGSALKVNVPPERHDALVAEMKKTDPRFLRRQSRLYVEYLKRHDSLVARLRDSGAWSWVAFGERDDVKLADNERRELEACPRVTLVMIPDTGHLTINEKPGRIAELILEAVSAGMKRSREPPERGRCQLAAKNRTPRRLGIPVSIPRPGRFHVEAHAAQHGQRLAGPLRPARRTGPIITAACSRLPPP